MRGTLGRQHMVRAGNFIAIGNGGLFTQEQRAVIVQIGKPPIQIVSLHLKVFRRILIRDLYGLFAAVAQNDLAIIPPSRFGIIAVKLRQFLDHTRDQFRHLVGNAPIRGDQPDR